MQTWSVMLLICVLGGACASVSSSPSRGSGASSVGRRPPGGTAATARAPGSTAATARAPGSTAATARAPGSTAATARAPGSTAATARAPGSTAATARAPGSTAATARAPGSTAATARAPGSTAATARAPGSTAATGRAPVASAARARRTVAGTGRAPRTVAATGRAPRTIVTTGRAPAAIGATDHAPTTSSPTSGAPDTSGAASASEASGRDRRAASNDLWLNLISEYSRGAWGAAGVGGAAAATHTGASSWFPPLIPARISTHDDAKTHASIPVLVLPVPVPVPGYAAAEQYSLSALQLHTSSLALQQYGPRYDPSQINLYSQRSYIPHPYYNYNPLYNPWWYYNYNAPHIPPASPATLLPPAPSDPSATPTPPTPPIHGLLPPPALPQSPVPPAQSEPPTTPAPPTQFNTETLFQEPITSGSPSISAQPAPSTQPNSPNARPAPPTQPNLPNARPAPPTQPNLTNTRPAPFMKSQLPLTQNVGTPLNVPVDTEYESPSVPPRTLSPEYVRRARMAPNFPPVEDSMILLKQFRAQMGTNLAQPAVVIEPIEPASPADYTVEQRPHWRGPQSEPARPRVACSLRAPFGSEQASAAPPALRFDRSLFIRARLAVPRSDYTEPYSLWWDASSGAARVDFNDGHTSAYRIVRDGRVKYLQIRMDRTGSEDKRVCMTTRAQAETEADRRLPALPDLRGFQFAGYVQRYDGPSQPLELWRQEVRGAGARGELLTFRHELLVERAPENYHTTPLWYSVRVNSSLLGADCDGYVHYFDEVQRRDHDPAVFELTNVGGNYDACDEMMETNIARDVQPLLEFTMLRRDPQYDADFQQYTELYQRAYVDDTEQAIRKTVLVQTSRSVAAGNRCGATFVLEVNFLADRLEVEIQVLLGVPDEPEPQPGEPFGVSSDILDSMRGHLPRRFDWRDLGGVSPVRWQGLCPSCWAFATSGAVQGAMFRATNLSVPLSEQALLDCSGNYGTNGCSGGSHPSKAYNYIKDLGLPARYEYTKYTAKCRAESAPAVTRISGHLKVPRDVVALKVAIKMYGPTVVVLNAKLKSFLTHKDGFYYDGNCKPGKSHAMLAVGWSTSRGETYFILKNSWSTAWGEAGYMRIRAGTDTCGVLDNATMPRLAAADVLRAPPAPAAPDAPDGPDALAAAN